LRRGPREREGPIGLEALRRLQRVHRGQSVARLHQGHAEQVRILGDGRAHARQRLQGQDRGHGRAHGQRDLGGRAQHVFRVRRQRARAAQRFERARRVPPARLQARELKQRGGGLEAVDGRAELRSARPDGDACSTAAS
jgi:hypothetical protein